MQEFIVLFFEGLAFVVTYLLVPLFVYCFVLLLSSLQE